MMDSAERRQYRQLVNDSIIATFGEETREARLAAALEACLDYLDDEAKCGSCDPCDNHSQE